MKPDGLIMADPGLIMLVREQWPEVPVYLRANEYSQLSKPAILAKAGNTPRYFIVNSRLKKSPKSASNVQI